MMIWRPNYTSFAKFPQIMSFPLKSASDAMLEHSINEVRGPKSLFGIRYGNHTPDMTHDHKSWKRIYDQRTIVNLNGKHVVLGTPEQHYCWSLLFRV
jgi:hypothetical protein